MTDLMSVNETGMGAVTSEANPPAPEVPKMTAAELREALARAEQEEGVAAEPTGSIATPEADPFPGATHQYEIPCDEILRAGRATTVAMRLAAPCAILGVVLAEGLSLIGLKLAGKLFDEDACTAGAFAGVTVLGSQDNLELFVRNVSNEDRMFEGILVLGPHKVVGYQPKQYAGARVESVSNVAHARPNYPGLPNYGPAPAAAPRPDAVEGADPAFATRGRNPRALVQAAPPQRTPGQPQPMPDRYGGRSGPRAAPPPPDLSVPVRRPGAPPIHKGGGLVEGEPVTPGPNEVALCVTREQAMKLYDIVVLGNYVAPFLRVDLKRVLERALS